MQVAHHNLLLRLPKHPTIAGWFWLCYFIGLATLGWSIFG